MKTGFFNQRMPTWKHIPHKALIMTPQGERPCMATPGTESDKKGSCDPYDEKFSPLFRIA